MPLNTETNTTWSDVLTKVWTLQYYDLNSTSAVLQQGWLCHWIGYEGLYGIKQRNRND